MNYYGRKGQQPCQLHGFRNSSPQLNQSLNMSTECVYSLEEGQQRYEQLVKENLWLKDQIQRKRQGQPVDPNNVYIRNITQGIPLGGDKTKNDMILWGMIERNRFLEDKLAKLQRQHERQYSTIRKIQDSQEWQNRHICVPSKCYHQRYMQLLRVRSPFF